MVKIIALLLNCILVLCLCQTTQAFRLLEPTIDPDTNICTGVEGSAYRPYVRAFNASQGLFTHVYNIWLSKTEDKLFTLSYHRTPGGNERGIQISKRNMDLTPVYEKSYNFDIDLRASTMDMNQTMMYIVNFNNQYNYVSNFNSTTGDAVIIREIRSINLTNSIAVTEKHVLIATRILPRFQRGILVMDRSDLSIVNQIGLETYNFVSVHQMEGLNSQVLMIIHSVAQDRRRNLVDATNGGRVGFQLIDSTGSNTIQQLACGSEDCSYSSHSRAIRRSSGEILTSVRVESEILLLIEFRPNMKYSSIHQYIFTTAHSYMISLVEFPEANLIYSLIGSNPALSTPSLDPILVMFNSDTKEVIERWQINFERKFINIMNQKDGFVYFGGRDDDGLGFLYKTVPSSFLLLEDKVSFESGSRDGIVLHDESRYTVSEVQLVWTRLNNATEGTELPNPVSYSYKEIIDPSESSNSTFVWTGELFSNISVVKSGRVTQDFGLPCCAEGQYWTYDVQIEPSEEIQVSIEDRKLIVKAPANNTVQRYNVTIRISSEFNYFTQYAQVLVEPCTVQNCQTCLETSGSVCQICQEDFTLDNGECLDEDDSIELFTARALGKTVSITATVSVSAVLIGSILSGESGSSAWVMINQYQLLLTTPTLETGLPEDVLVFLEEFEFFTLNFNFLEGWTLWKFEDVIDRFDYDQTVEGLNTVGYESGSVIVNQYNLGKALALLVLTDVSLLLVFLIFKKYLQKATIKSVIEKFESFYFFTAYVRIIIEAFFFVFLTALSEVYENIGDIQDGLSYGAAIIISLTVFLIPGFLLWHYFRYRNIQNLAEDGKLTELYDGFKPRPLCQLYNFIFCSRRILNALIVVLLSDLPILVRLLTFDIVQLAGLAYSTIIRPFEEPRDNFLEILNDSFFMVFCIVITILYKEDHWNSSISNIVLYSIMVNGLLIALFCIVMSIKDVTISIVKKCRINEDESKSSQRESLASFPNESTSKKSRYNKERASRKKKSPTRKRSEDELMEEFKIEPKSIESSQGQSGNSSVANSDMATKTKTSHTKDEHCSSKNSNASLHGEDYQGKPQKPNQSVESINFSEANRKSQRDKCSPLNSDRDSHSLDYSNEQSPEESL
ncbi:unnamed protein product [Moneuplotes crassus]|uniref:Uncharacterized protein n=1 Tax=Euplotes crassus TaxID=5936 RepID=A0AAD1UFD5_EUPCR|nr:unnamed protein product [Moneuplotes crassus]